MAEESAFRGSSTTDAVDQRLADEAATWYAVAVCAEVHEAWSAIDRWSEEWVADLDHPPYSLLQVCMFCGASRWQSAATHLRDLAVTGVADASSVYRLTAKAVRKRLSRGERSVRDSVRDLLYRTPSTPQDGSPISQEMASGLYLIDDRLDWVPRTESQQAEREARCIEELGLVLHAAEILDALPRNHLEAAIWAQLDP